MKLSLSATRIAVAALLFAIVSVTGMVGCTNSTPEPRPATEEEKQKLNDEMQKMQKKANKAKASK